MPRFVGAFFFASTIGAGAKAIAAEIEGRKSADALIIAEQRRWYTAIIRPLLAASVIIYLWKVIVRDIVLGANQTCKWLLWATISALMTHLRHRPDRNPQCSSLLPYRSVLSLLFGSTGGTGQ